MISVNALHEYIFHNDYSTYSSPPKIDILLHLEKRDYLTLRLSNFKEWEREEDEGGGGYINAKLA